MTVEVNGMGSLNRRLHQRLHYLGSKNALSKNARQSAWSIMRSKLSSVLMVNRKGHRVKNKERFYPRSRSHALLTPL